MVDKKYNLHVSPLTVAYNNANIATLTKKAADCELHNYKRGYKFLNKWVMLDALKHNRNTVISQRMIFEFHNNIKQKHRSLASPKSHRKL